MLDDFLNICQNWRVHVLFALCLIQVILTFAESEDLLYLFIIKFFAYFVGWVIYKLFKYWDARGELEELNKFREEE